MIWFLVFITSIQLVFEMPVALALNHERNSQSIIHGLARKKIHALTGSPSSDHNQPGKIEALKKDLQSQSHVGLGVSKIYSNKIKEQCPIDLIDFSKSGTYKLAPFLSVLQLAQILDYELSSQKVDGEIKNSNEPWLITGRINPIYFSKNFLATDIDRINYDSLEAYARSMYYGYDQDISRAQTISCVKSGDNTITVTARISGRKFATIGGMKKMVNLKPYLQYTDYIVSPKTGLIISQEDRAAIPTWDIYLSGTMPMLNGLLTAKVAEEVPAREVEKPVFMSPFEIQGKLDAVELVRKSLDPITIGVSSAMDFVIEMVKSKQNSTIGNEENEILDPATKAVNLDGLNHAVDDYIDLLSSSGLDGIDIDDMNRALDAISKSSERSETAIKKSENQNNDIPLPDQASAVSEGGISDSINHAIKDLLGAFSPSNLEKIDTTVSNKEDHIAGKDGTEINEDNFDTIRDAVDTYMDALCSDDLGDFDIEDLTNALGAIESDSTGSGSKPDNLEQAYLNIDLESKMLEAEAEYLSLLNSTKEIVAPDDK